MDQSETRIRSPQGQLVANGGSVGNSLAPGPTAPTPNRTQVHSRFNSLDLRWQRRVHVRHCYPPRELANGEFETRFCNVCPIWRWPDIGGNALIQFSYARFFCCVPITFVLPKQPSFQTTSFFKIFGVRLRRGRKHVRGDPVLVLNCPSSKVAVSRRQQSRCFWWTRRGSTPPIDAQAVGLPRATT